MASPIMRIPRMDVRVVRDLLDIGIRELYELRGRAAESIFEEVKKGNQIPQSGHWRIFAWPYIFAKKKILKHKSFIPNFGRVNRIIYPLPSSLALAFFVCQTIKSP